MNPALGRLVAEAYRHGVDVSLSELAELLAVQGEDVLPAAVRVLEALPTLGLEVRPGVEVGDFHSRRALVPPPDGDVRVDVLSDISNGESESVEFKSTLVADYKRYQATPSALVQNDGVTQSALKTICAFANCGGGRLLVGVEDNGHPCGLDADFQVLGSNFDGWENHLRNLVASRFHQGGDVNNFLRVRLGEHEQVAVAIVDVIGRTGSTFLKRKNGEGFQFFVRQGNRSTALEIQEFDLYLRAKFA